MTSAEIRNTFIRFFESKQHTIVASAPIVVKDDPTLMFTNAGMNQFKEIFLGNVPVKHPRIADTQKCLRVSGKHNDLEEVGFDTYHHTMFEMLGNWSFGDYFKKEAIGWAWELLTEVYGIDKDRLYVTVFGGDAADSLNADMEAASFWKQFVSEDRILLGSKKDNFWEMGDSGPCGPCSEIHADIRPDAERKNVDGKTLVNTDHPQVIEIWNLVFIEFNRMANGSLIKLPASHVDTGMGFERLCMVLQGVQSNYDTDIFQPFLHAIAQLSNVPYGADSMKDVAMRVIADHLRAVSFTIADGQLPSNTGAGYVIRRILRRAVRYGFTFLGFEEPFVYKLLPVLVEQMGQQFPEIAAQKELVAKVIFEEENSFLRTLAQGIRKFESYSQSNANLKVIDGDFAFELFDTYGFPVDLTKLLAREKGLELDLDQFQQKLEEQKSRSRKAAEVAAGDWVIVDSEKINTLFVGYETTQCPGKIVKYRQVIAKKQTYFELIMDQTPFYAESGGQVGDIGIIENEDDRLLIFNTIKENNLIVHLSETLPSKPEGIFNLQVDAARRKRIMANHSATHLMHAALRQTLGSHVEQKGSLVDDEKLRFDFSHFSKMTADEIRQVENMVNDKIRENLAGDVENNLPINEAKKRGAMALFGEKYGDFVRLVSFDPSYSVELCGGTHVEASGKIGLFRIVSESAIAAGVRRIEAVTGAVAEQTMHAQAEVLHHLKEILKSTGDLARSTQQLVDQNQMLQKQIEALMSSRAQGIAIEIGHKARLINEIQFICVELDEEAEMLKIIGSALKASARQTIAVLGSKTGGKASLCLVITDDLVDAKGLDAGKAIREAAKAIQGGGGGQKTLATAGGKNPEGIEHAFAEIERFVESVK